MTQFALVHPIRTRMGVAPGYRLVAEGMAGRQGTVSTRERCLPRLSDSIVSVSREVRNLKVNLTTGRNPMSNKLRRALLITSLVSGGLIFTGGQFASASDPCTQPPEPCDSAADCVDENCSCTYSGASPHACRKHEPD